MAKNNTRFKTTKQVGRFGAVGVANTLIDFGIYNLMISLFSLAAVPASIVSTTFAMAFSFIANRTFVFRSSDKDRLRQVIIFLAVSLFSAYVIQSAVIYFFEHIWTSPLNVGYNIVHSLLGNHFSHDFVINNGAKIAGVLTGLVWNFYWYKKVVFKQ